MIVKVSDLPTQGRLTFSVTDFEITPLTFGELLRYLGDEQLTPTREYVRALSYLVSRDPNIGELKILDADYIIYIFKAISSTKDAKLSLGCTCPHCHKYHQKDVKLNSISFNDISEQALTVKSVKLLDRTVKIKYTTISEFISFVGNLPRKIENVNIDTLKLLSMLDVPAMDMVAILEKSVQEDIALINYLDNIWFKLVDPVEINCTEYTERRTTVAFQMSAVDIFRSIVQLNPVTPDQILFGETMSTL